MTDYETTTRSSEALIQLAIIRLMMRRLVTQWGDDVITKWLLRQRDYLLGCLRDPAAEPTKNHGRTHAATAGKVSCGNRILRTWEILTSLAHTCHQNAEDFLDWLAPKLSLAIRTG